ncbi:MAG: PAS domain S-box protein [Thermoplasmata archaeon]|nr:PAS domain S-box protein [Thermoplasmata archaeon]
MVKLNLSGKILILLIVLSLVPLLSFSQFLSEKSMKEIRSNIENGIDNLVSAKTEDYNGQLHKFHLKIEALADYISPKWGNGTFDLNLAEKYVWVSPNGTGLEEHKDEIKNLDNILPAFNIISYNNDEINLVYFATKDGILFVNKHDCINALKSQGYFDPRERVWYINAEKENRTTWSKVYIDAYTGQLVTTISTPVYKNGKFLGVAAVDLLLNTIKNDILDIKFKGEGYAILVSRNGDIIVHPKYTAGGIKWNESFKEENIDNISALLPLKGEIMNGSHGIKKIRMASSYYAVFYPINEINGSLIFLLPSSVVKQPIERMQQIIWFVALLTAVAIILASILFSTTITQPIKNLKKATEEVAKGNFDYDVAIQSKDEIGELGENFNKMIKQLKQATKSIEESEKKYRDIFEYSQDAIYISTSEGKLIDINKAGEELFGYTRDELLKMNVENLYENREDREKFKMQISKKGYVKNYEVRLKKKNGKKMDCLLSTVMFKKGDKIIYQGIIKDITPIEEAREKLEIYNSMLRHDITNRLQIAIATLELLREEESKEEADELIKKAFDNLISINDLLLKLRMISIASNKKLKKVDLSESITKSIEYFRKIAEEKSIKIRYDGSGGYVIADEMLVNIFSNLIENSIKHSECKNIYISVKESNDEYIIEIRDDGKGIPEEIKDKIFEMGVKSRESRGSGLGLHLTKMIIESYGGKIFLKDVEKGAAFEIHLKKYS